MLIDVFEDPNSQAIMDARTNAFYSGHKSDVIAWAAEQVEVMTRIHVPAYYVSGGYVHVLSILVSG
jgi:hypothetical protein